MKKALATLGALALGLAVFAGCSSDDDKSSSTTTTKSDTSKTEVCQARSKLKKSLKALDDPSLIASGKSGVESALNGIEDDLNELTAAAKDDYTPQVDAVKSAVEDLKTKFNNLGDGSSVTAQIQAVGDAVSKVGSTTETLLDQVKASCP